MGIADGLLRSLDETIAGVVQRHGLPPVDDATARDIAMPFWLRECAYVYSLERRAAREHVDIGGEDG